MNLLYTIFNELLLNYESINYKYKVFKILKKNKFKYTKIILKNNTKIIGSMYFFQIIYMVCKIFSNYIRR